MSKPRVTQIDIARALSVSQQTVSLALRGDRSIPEASRNRIVQTAKILGFIPDPVISSLATSRWASIARREQVSIAIIDLNRDCAPPWGYDADIREGAACRARELGLSFSTLRLADFSGATQLTRVLDRRCVSGVVLLPAHESLVLETDIAWNKLSVVAATTSVMAPRFHQVVPNQLHNMKLLVESLLQSGHRRIGAIFDETVERRNAYSNSIELAWHTGSKSVLALSDQVPPVQRDRRIVKWLHQWNPDVVIVSAADEIGQLRCLGKAAGINFHALALELSIDLMPHVVGASAVEILNGLIVKHEWGIPLHRQSTKIEGSIRPTPPVTEVG